MLRHVSGDQVELLLGGDLALLKVDFDFAIYYGAQREGVAMISDVV